MEWFSCTDRITGRGHEARGLCCQDRTYSLTHGGVSAIALADGAGSKPLSHEGAEAAVRAVCETLCKQFDFFSTTATPMQVKSTLLDAVKRAIHNRAESLGVPDADLPCTLLAAACRNDSYLLFHIGDGVIGYQKAGKTHVASAPDNGEFANTTVFVTSPQALAKCRVLRGTQPEIEGFVLMSDGCEAALYAKKKKRLAPLTGKLICRTALLRENIAQAWLQSALHAASHYTTDDCSLAVLAKQQENVCSMTLPEQAELLGIRTQNRNRRRRSLKKYHGDFR